MGINILDTEIGVKLRKTKLLMDSIVWYDSVDFNVRNMILNWIQNDQLRAKGEDEFNEVIGYYSLATDFISGGKKKFNTHFTLEDTGEFFQQMFVVVMKDSLVIDSDGADKVGDDGSQTNLFTEYGNKIVGLNDKNMGKLVEVLRPKYIKFARKVLELD